VDGSYYRGICGPPEEMVPPLGRICNHRALYTGCIIRQEYSEGPDNIDRGTSDCSSEFSLRLFGPSGREVASNSGKSESRNR
jgi:hypothetical protein